MAFFGERLASISRFVASRLGPAAIPLVRLGFDRGGARLARAMRGQLPAAAPAPQTIRYRGAYGLDFYRAPKPMPDAPMVVWVHGGGWIAGSRHHVGPYCAMLAARGFDAAAIDYMLAPRARFPNPLRDLDAALSRLARDTSRSFVLAGDSAGAHIVASYMLAVHDPDYARAIGFQPLMPSYRLAGQMLYSGVFGTRLDDTPPTLKAFRKIFLNAYARSAQGVDLLARTLRRLPPTLIAVGDTDKLVPQSTAFANRLEQAGTPVTRVFVPPGSSAGHEYQFDLARMDARDTLMSTIQFLAQICAPDVSTLVLQRKA